MSELNAEISCRCTPPCSKISPISPCKVGKTATEGMIGGFPVLVPKTPPVAGLAKPTASGCCLAEVCETADLVCIDGQFYYQWTIPGLTDDFIDFADYGVFKNFVCQENGVGVRISAQDLIEILTQAQPGTPQSDAFCQLLVFHCGDEIFQHFINTWTLEDLVNLFNSTLSTDPAASAFCQAFLARCGNSLATFIADNFSQILNGLSPADVNAFCIWFVATCGGVIISFVRDNFINILQTLSEASTEAFCLFIITNCGDQLVQEFLQSLTGEQILALIVSVDPNSPEAQALCEWITEACE